MTQALEITALALALNGCSLFSEPVCLAVETPGMVVWLRDAATEELVAEVGASVDAIRGQIRVPLEERGVPGRFEGLDGFEGVWTVRAESPSYEVWSTTGVETRRTECGMRTAEVTARMVPLGSD